MRRLIVSCVLFLGWSVAAGQQSLRPDGPVAFVNGMLLDGYEAEPIHRAVVVIDDGRIVAAGPQHATPVPAGATVIDIGGRAITPGLIDAHVHVDLIGHGDYDRYYRFLRGTERLKDVMPIAAKQMLRAGVTSALDLGTPFQILELRERAQTELGDDFDLKKFHNVILSNGAVPLEILETLVDDWIAETKAA